MDDEKEIDTKINLCSTCEHDFESCHSISLEFGDGLGKDNVINCDNYNNPVDCDTYQKEED